MALDALIYELYRRRCVIEGGVKKLKLYLDASNIEDASQVMGFFEKSATGSDDNSEHLRLVIHFQEKYNTSGFTIDEALSLLPLFPVVFLEDLESDLGFLKAIFRCYKKNHKIRQLERMVFHCGGKTRMKRFLDLRLKLLEKMNESQRKILKSMVQILADSDRVSLEAKVENKMQETCRLEEIECHILEKREIENYLPLACLKEYCEENKKVKKFEAYSRMTIQQRDFYDLKKGFGCQNLEEIKRAHPDYASLKDQDLQRLSDGFSSRVWEAFSKLNHEKQLTDTDAKNEMKCILTKLERLL